MVWDLIIGPLIVFYRIITAIPLAPVDQRMRFSAAWIAAHQPVGGHNSAQKWPVLLKGLEAIMGAGGIHLAAVTAYR